MPRRKKTFWLPTWITLLILISTGGVCWKLGWVPISWEKLSTGELLGNNTADADMQAADLEVDPIIDNAQIESLSGLSNHHGNQQLDVPEDATLTRTSPPRLMQVPDSREDTFIPNNRMASAGKLNKQHKTKKISLAHPAMGRVLPICNHHRFLPQHHK